MRDEASAYVGREMARSKGVQVNRQVHPWRPKSELTLSDRRERATKAKKHSTCRSCGKAGHWAGDPECPKKSSAMFASAKGRQKTKGKGKSKNSQPAQQTRFSRAGLLAMREEDGHVPEQAQGSQFSTSGNRRRAGR